MPLHHTKNLAKSAEHAANRIEAMVWEQTHDVGQAMLAGCEAYQGMLKENILDMLPECQNPTCDFHLSSDMVTNSSNGLRHFCNACSQVI
jgi:hypothetical protein